MEEEGEIHGYRGSVVLGAHRNANGALASFVVVYGACLDRNAVDGHPNGSIALDRRRSVGD